MTTQFPDDAPETNGSAGPEHREPLDDDELLADDLDYGLPDPEDGPNWTLIVGVLVAMGAIAFLVFDGLEAETYFFDVDEAVEQGDALAGETVRIRGDVRPGSIETGDDALDHTFAIGAGGESMTVAYDRALPDTFEEDSEVVAEGTLDDQMVLHADEVLVKCPSRYEGAPPTSDDDYGDYQNIEDYDAPSQQSDDPHATR